MARRQLVKTGTGLLTAPIRIVIGDEGNLTDQAIVAINNNMDEAYRKINGQLTFGDGSQSSWAGNFFGQWIEFLTPSVADTEFAVDHGLGYTPVGRIVMRQDAAGQLYDSNIFGWGSDTVYFKCDVGDVLMKILLLG
jgi:hypothetical protein